MLNNYRSKVLWIQFIQSVNRVVWGRDVLQLNGEPQNLCEIKITVIIYFHRNLSVPLLLSFLSFPLAQIFGPDFSFPSPGSKETIINMLSDFYFYCRVASAKRRRVILELWKFGNGCNDVIKRRISLPNFFLCEVVARFPQHFCTSINQSAPYKPFLRWKVLISSVGNNFQ